MNSRKIVLVLATSGLPVKQIRSTTKSVCLPLPVHSVSIRVSVCVCSHLFGPSGGQIGKLVQNKVRDLNLPPINVCQFLKKMD